MAFFGGLKDIIVQKPVRKRHSIIFQRCDDIGRKVESEILEIKGVNKKDGEYADKCFFDTTYFLLNSLDLNKLNYVLEAYWFYYEFQLNTSLALGMSCPFYSIWIFSKLNSLD